MRVLEQKSVSLRSKRHLQELLDSKMDEYIGE